MIMLLAVSTLTVLPTAAAAAVPHTRVGIYTSFGPSIPVYTCICADTRIYGLNTYDNDGPYRHTSDRGSSQTATSRLLNAAVSIMLRYRTVKSVDRLYRDAQKRLLWRDKTCPGAPPPPIMSQKR